MTDDIEARAGRWILKRDRDEITAEERAAFESWLAADSRHRAAFLRLNGAWQASVGLTAWRPSDGSVELDVLASAARRPTPRHLWTRVIAAAILMAVTGISSWVAWQRASGTTYATQVGGYQRILLEDGSALQLNTDSNVRVRLMKERRVVRLVRGEVFFDIAHDASRPFDVIAGRTIVRAVGTAFAVRLRDSRDVEVTVTQGRVALRSDDDLPAFKAPVSAGEVADAKPAGIAVTQVAGGELTRRLAWQRGELAFKKERLAHIVAEFNRYNRRQLVIGDVSLDNLEVGGNFKATDLDSFVAAVTHSLNVRAEESQDTIRFWAR
jgi:transmembrane sensor